MDKITKAMKLMAKAMDLLEQARDEQPVVRLDKGPKPSSGEKGVVQDKRTGKWGARIWRDGKSIWLGTFETRDEAADVRWKALSTLPHSEMNNCE